MVEIYWRAYIQIWNSLNSCTRVLVSSRGQTYATINSKSKYTRSSKILKLRQELLLSTRKEQIRREDFGTSQFENYHWPVTWPRFVLLQLFQAYGDLFLCLGSRVAELRDEICPKFWQISRRRRPRTKGKKTPEKGRGMGIADGAPSRPPLHNVIIRELRIQNVCQQKVQMAQSKKKGRGSSWSYLCTALVVIIIWSKSVRKFKLVKND